MRLAKGFSLIELMIVMALCTLLLGFGLVSVRSLHKSTLRAELQLLYAACVYLQQQAIATNRTQELLLDVTANAYRFNGHEHRLAPGVCFGVALNAHGPPSAPYKPLTHATTFAQDTIIFYPEGMMSAGMACITNDRRDALYAISSAVGHVVSLRKYSYDGAWHSMH